MAEGGEGAQGGANAGTTGGTTTDGGSAQGGAGTGTDQNGQSGQQNGGATGAPATVSAEEHEKIRARMQAADQRAAKFEQELRALKDKDLPEAEKLKRDHEELAQRAAKFEQELRSARIENAFLQSNKHNWHDPSAALRMADLSSLDIADDGSVSGLDNVLNDLAKKNPWMVKPKGDAGEGNSGEGQGQAGGNQAGPATGAPSMNGGASGGARSSRGQAARRFPVLNTRPKRG